MFYNLKLSALWHGDRLVASPRQAPCHPSFSNLFFQTIASGPVYRDRSTKAQLICRTIWQIVLRSVRFGNRPAPAVLHCPAATPAFAPVSLLAPSTLTIRPASASETTKTSTLYSST